MHLIKSVFSICLATFTAAYAAPTPPSSNLSEEQKVSDRQALVSAIMAFVPGKTTQAKALGLLPQPLVTRTSREQTIFAYRLNAPLGVDLYDVFLTFQEGILVQIERPVLEARFTEAKMKSLYGKPDRIEIRPSTQVLPQRTFYYFPSKGRTFIRDNRTLHFMGVIEYKPTGTP